MASIFHMPKNPIRFTVYAAFVLAALAIMADLLLPGRVYNNEVLAVKKERQQYYNAARNFHYSYKVVTADHQFWVAEDLAELLQDQKNIEYSVSLIFSEVNWYRLPTAESRSFYSLRIISGLGIPLLVIILLAVDYRFKNIHPTLVFVLQALLIADLIFLWL